MTDQDFDPPPGVPATIGPRLRRVLAPNPSPMTFRGTNTFLLGEASLCVIDPGPDDPAHLAALLQAIGKARVSHIVVTHSHLDHSPLARALSQATGAPVLGYGDRTAGRSATMTRLAAEGMAGGGEGADVGFNPDIALADRQSIDGVDWRLKVLHTPGHFGNHVCLRWQDAILTGDHVMGWASTLVSPPDGDLGDFMRSCERLLDERATVLHPAHGAPVRDPAGRLGWLIAHRRAREAQIVAALHHAPATAAALTRTVYTDIAPAMLPAAERNVFAHLVDLVERNLATATPRPALDAVFSAPAR